MKKSKSRGYYEKTRLEILKSIKNGWKMILKKSENGERPLHRSRGFQKEARKEEKIKKVLNWYKGKDGKSFDSVLMIPATPGGELKRKFEEKAKQEGLKLRIVEKTGMKLGGYLKKFDRTKSNQTCGDKDCLVCKNSVKKNSKCRIPNIVYKITCMECEKEKLKSPYYGESHFNGFTRGGQHQKNYRSKNKKVQEDSALRRHAQEVHKDKKVEYRMEILKTFKSPLERQVFESTQIIKSKSEDDFPMNSKKEFNQALIVTAKFNRGIHNE